MVTCEILAGGEVGPAGQELSGGSARMPSRLAFFTVSPVTDTPLAWMRMPLALPVASMTVRPHPADLMRRPVRPGVTTLALSDSGYVPGRMTMVSFGPAWVRA